MLKDYKEYIDCRSNPACTKDVNNTLEYVGQLYATEIDYRTGQNGLDAKACSGLTPLTCGANLLNRFFKSTDGVRTAGALQAVSGSVGVVADVGAAIGAAATCPDSVGAGCVATGAAVVNVAANVDQVATGLKQLINGTPSYTDDRAGLRQDDRAVRVHLGDLNFLFPTIRSRRHTQLKAPTTPAAALFPPPRPPPFRVGFDAA